MNNNNRIVVLDALPLDADRDLDWTPLRALGEVTLHDRTLPAEVGERVRDADFVLTNKVRLGEAEFAAAPRLRLIGELATGYDNIDVTAARSRGIVVSNVPGYSSALTAQTAIALLLELCCQVGHHATQVRRGEWARRGVWSFWDPAPTELDGKTLLVVGTGKVGGRVARIAEALEMNVLAAILPGREGVVPGSGDGGFARLPLNEALSQADVVSLHCPLTSETRGLIDAERLTHFKPDALLVNTGRGPLVDDQAVADALHSGRLGGFAADVLSVEPPTNDNPLLTAPRYLVTPHIGWASRPARARLIEVTVANLKAFLDGHPQNIVGDQ